MKQTPINADLYSYIENVSLREHPVLTKLRQLTATLPGAGMQIAPMQGQLLQFLLRVSNARKVLELGTYTGYSTLAMALALPADGKVITCDISAEATNIAQEFWHLADQASKIELRLAPGLNSMQSLVASEPHSFDFIFIDADKSNYPNYYALALKLLKSNGVLAIDNVLWDGKVVDQNDVTNQTQAIRQLNKEISGDTSVNVCLIPIADGLFLVQPKGERNGN